MFTNLLNDTQGGLHADMDDLQKMRFVRNSYGMHVLSRSGGGSFEQTFAASPY